MTEEEIQEFKDTVAAVKNMLDRLIYAASSEDVAAYLVDELPTNGYRIVKMTEEEVKQWKEEYFLVEPDDDVEINELVWDEEE